MSVSLAGRKILLGVCGGIAAYKSAVLVRRLQDAGAEVRVVLTANAARFVTATTFQALSGHPVRSSLWDEAAEAAMGHIELARWADVVLVAPASADTLARLAHGLADDLLATLCLASEAPLVVAPAMNRQMWAHPATQANLGLLRQRGVQVLGPAAGSQACGETGAGRMLEPEQLVAALSADGPVAQLSGLRVVVTAGPTHEDVDPVRFIGNRSSGRMGFAVAAEAVRAGAVVTLVAGPVALATPPGVRRVDVRSALQMRDAVDAALPGADLFIAAAAVADFRPAAVLGRKFHKGEGKLELELVENPDILAGVAALPNGQRPFVVGFAAETEDLETRAEAKRRRKGADLIAANLVGADLAFDRDDNALLLLWDGGRAELPTAPKALIARQLLACVAERMVGAGA